MDSALGIRPRPSSAAVIPQVTESSMKIEERLNAKKPSKEPRWGSSGEFFTPRPKPQSIEEALPFDDRQARMERLQLERHLAHAPLHSPPPPAATASADAGAHEANLPTATDAWQPPLLSRPSSAKRAAFVQHTYADADLVSHMARALVATATTAEAAAFAAPPPSPHDQTHAAASAAAFARRGGGGE